MLRRILTTSNGRHLSASVAKTTQLLRDSALTLLDVGAAGGAPLRWNPYASLINYVAVEPDPRSTETLASTNKDGYRSCGIVTLGLWSETRDLELNLCRKAQVSSVYVPNATFLGHFSGAERYDIVGRTTMKVTTIDAIATEQRINIDALKIDVQGAELEVLRGAERVLDDVLLVEAEVEFVSLYENQPLFGSVSHMLGQRGFELVDFVTLTRWHPRSGQFGTGQLVFADALFMRTPESLKSKTSTTHRKYAALAMMYQRGEMLARLARVVNDSSLIRQLEELEQFVSIHTSQSQRLLSVAARVARLLTLRPASPRIP